jgi:pimeloyl-ACP methyl ester carboxylesterase
MKLRTAAYLAATAAAPPIAYAFQRRRHQHRYGADRLHHGRSVDGFRIALWRFEGDGRRRHPVLLCPGLGANRFSFEPHPDVSFAGHLRDAGFDTWVVELRGHGASDRATRARPHGWSFDDHLTADIPAAIDGVRRITGADSVHFIGHSMGGLLLYAHLAHTGGLGLRSGVTIGSSLDYCGSGSWFLPLTRLRGLTRHVPAIPLGALQTLASPFGPSEGPLHEFNIWLPNTDPRVWRKLQAIGWHSVSANVLGQLATAFDDGGLTSFDGRTRYLDGVHRADVPVMAIAGSVDRQCPPSAAQRTAAQLSHPASRLATFGKDHGEDDEYGHFDLMIGKRAPRETWPHVVAWLEDRD